MRISSQNYKPTQQLPPFLLPSVGVSKESNLLKDAFVNESLRAILHYVTPSADPNVFVYTYLEQLLQYQRPKSKKSYKMKIHIKGKIKGKPIDFGYGDSY